MPVKTRKLFGGFNLFRQSAVAEQKKYKTQSEQEKEDEIKIRKEIRDLEEKIDNASKEEKKAIDAIKETTEKNKKQLEQLKANLKAVTKSWFGGRKAAVTSLKFGGQSRKLRKLCR